MKNGGPTAGAEVAQLYLGFPSATPGDSAANPEWRLAGFSKKTLKPGETQMVAFELGTQQLSFWDDAPGASKWACAPGMYKACVGANSRDAIDATKGACTSFKLTC